MKRLALLAVLLGSAALADEGMWTSNNFPSASVKKKYGFDPDQQWLDHVRLSSARLAGGCSGSFVSPDGLVMSNHHCAHACIEQLSTKDRDYVATGFYAAALKDEVRCPEIEVNQLVQITDVTARIGTATKDKKDRAYADALKAEMSKIEQECAAGTEDVRCDVVTLYRGGRYDLYRYRRFQDVRLVFAPEFNIAFFGGDPDNFNFPRYDLDVSFLRVYQNGAPAKMDHYFRWSTTGAKEGDLTFTAGHPGRTSRLMTIPELEFDRDQGIPFYLLYLSELRGILGEFANRGAEQKRVATTALFSVENSVKAFKGRRQALVDKAFFASKVAQENDLKKRIAGKKAYSGVYESAEKSMETMRAIRLPYWLIEGERDRPRAFPGDICAIARKLVRSAEERKKPNEQRMREYVDSALPQVKQRVFSSAPIHEELEATLLAFGLTKLREELGADHPVVKKVLGKDSPEDVAKRVVSGTKLKDIAVRQKLYDGGQEAIEASTDPAIQLVRLVEPDARAIRARFENEVDGVLKKAQESIARARFDAYGAGQYPDATFTLRVSYGSVEGWQENGQKVVPFTTLGGAFERATGKFPFALPKTWVAAKDKLDLSTPFNVATSNDIIGGNSGSPLINKDAEVVGLIFDGNLQSLGGDYGFDARANRSTSVTSTALTEALEKVYKADRILQELRATHATK
ncbi:MAG TPA: S46 family peptidase [Myxococcaceae bacterium]